MESENQSGSCKPRQTSSDISDTNFDYKFYLKPIFEKVVFHEIDEQESLSRKTKISSLLRGNIPPAVKQIQKKMRLATKCHHTTAEYYAKGMCARCYHVQKHEANKK